MSGTFSRGSVWSKWDMHVHSPFSHLNNHYNCTSKELAEKIVEENISVVGLTNYFVVDEQEIVELRDALAGRALVIPNFEFRTNDKNKDNEFINIHVLFNPDLALERVYGCLQRVKLNNLSEDIPYYCTLENIKKFGADTITVSFDELVAELNIDFDRNDDFLIVGVNRGYGGFYPDNKPRNTQLAKKLDKSSDFIFGKIDDRNFFLNKTPGREALGLKPKVVVHASDAHTLSKVGENFTWIKAVPSWDGLQQIIFEPEQRVQIQVEIPDNKDKDLIIDEVKFSSTKSSLFPNESIKLNPNLNVIIGGKSSGKSLLLFYIAKTLEKDQEVTNTDDEGSKYDFVKSIDDKFDFHVKSAAGVIQSLSSRIEESSILPDIKYLPQNKLTRLAEPEVYKESASLLQLVRDLLLEEESCKESYSAFIKKIKENDISRPAIIEKLFNTKDDISVKETELRGYGNVSVLKNSIKIAEQEIASLKQKSGLSAERMVEYDELQQQIKSTNAEILRLQDDHEQILNLLSESLAELNQMTLLKNNLRQVLLTDEGKALLDSEYGVIDDAIVKLEEFVDRNDQEVDKSEAEKLSLGSSLSIKVDDLKKTKTQLEGRLVPFIQNENLKKEIATLEQKILKDKQKQQRIEKQKEVIQGLKDELEKIESELWEDYKANFDLYPEIIKKLQKRTESLVGDKLEITGSVKFNHHKFKKEFLHMMDGRRAYTSELSLVNQSENMMDIEWSDLLQEVKSLYDQITRGDFPLISRFPKKEAIKKLLDDYFVDYWEVTYRNDTLGEMSTGKASFVILMLIIGLSDSKAPILIDQPEDNLDNRSITRDLVAYLREKKLDRQIILVTHNPNIVVNADSENIIVANQRGQNDRESSSPFRFDYVNGAIENSKPIDSTETDLLKSMGIRQHIAEVVEGGEEAFKKRREKYRFGE